MAKSEVVEQLVGRLQALGPVRARAMFGGYGVYCADVMFGLVADEQLYFKVDDRNRAAYEEAGLGPFVYGTEGRAPVAMSYWRVPDAAYVDDAILIAWAQPALAAAQHNYAAKRQRVNRRNKRSSKPGMKGEI